MFFFVFEVPFASILVVVMQSFFANPSHGVSLFADSGRTYGDGLLVFLTCWFLRQFDHYQSRSEGKATQYFFRFLQTAEETVVTLAAFPHSLVFCGSSTSHGRDQGGKLRLEELSFEVTSF